MGGSLNRRQFLESTAATGLLLAGCQSRRTFALAEEGGFLPSIDHSVPADISFDYYRYYVEGMKKALGMQ